MSKQLAELNIAHVRADMNDPIMRGFVEGNLSPRRCKKAGTCPATLQILRA